MPRLIKFTLMKKLRVIMLVLIAAIALGSCERAYFEEGEEPAETVGGDDNGGWYDDDTPGEYGDFALGDEVDVQTFKTNAIYTQVWVKGYIVGAATGANNRNRYEFGPEFTFDTAILLADTPDASDIDEVISVCLTGGSESRRSKLNLKDHPENKGQRIAVFGFQDRYLGLFGIKAIDAYEFPAE